MELTPPLAPSNSTSIRVGLPEPIDRYLAQLADEQTRFLGALTDANRRLHPSSGQVAKLASIQLRLTQEFLDAQRAIVRRRAETDVAITAITTDAAWEGVALLDVARSRAAIAVCTPAPSPNVSVAGMLAPPAAGQSPLPLPAPRFRAFAPPSSTDRKGSPGVDDESLARLIDGVFESSEPDGVAARRELRDLLDGWWRVENQEAQAAIDDAHARAAMHLHLAHVEAGELERFAPPTPVAPAPAPYAPRSSTGLPGSVVTALDDTDHEHLDDVLAHLLDSLEASELARPEAPATPTDGESSDETSLIPRLPDREPAAADSLNDSTAEPQEAFDRFWGTFTVSGSRSWLFSQLLLPAVTVIAVLALVLAVVG